MRTHLCLLLICVAATSGCTKHPTAEEQKAADDAQWKQSVAKAEAERIAHEKEFSEKLDRDRRDANAKAEADTAAAQAFQLQVAEANNIAILKNALFDPDSSQIRNISWTSDHESMCGEVNAKNKMGGYVGFKNFVIYKNTPFVDSDLESNHLIYARIAELVSCSTK